MIALFDGDEARDFANVHILASRSGSDRLLELAAAIDAGFDKLVFADMLDTLARFTDAEIPAPAAQVPAIRAFAADWTTRLGDRHLDQLRALVVDLRPPLA